MTDSMFVTTGLNADLYEAPWRNWSVTHLGGTGWIRSLTSEVSSYGHDMAAMGGFIGANLVLKNQTQETIPDWLEMGLGREIRVTDGTTKVSCFEGFINRIDFSIEGFHFTVGPFMDIINRAKLVYSLIDWSTGQAIAGIRGSSDWVQDDNSVDKYGQLPKVLSTGGIDYTLITQLLQLTLEKYRNPPRTEDITFGAQAKKFEVRLELLGWSSLLDRYYYTYKTSTLMSAGLKIAFILGLHPYQLFSVAGVEDVGPQMTTYENDDATAWSIIKAIAAQGDSSFTRYIFGVYEGRTAYYAPVDDSRITYVRPLNESLKTLLDTNGEYVQPWNVRPGKWVQIGDLLALRPAGDNTATNPRKFFIENVSFRAPDTLVLNGSQSFKIEQRLAQLGISGIGV